MSQNVKGSFVNGASVGVGETSAELVIPSGAVSMKLNATGLDGSNTIKTQKTTNNGHTWVDQTTYNSNQVNTVVTVAHGEQWRLFCITQQAIKVIDYSMSVES